MRRSLLAATLAAAVLGIAAGATGAARAADADECRGLPVCVPVPGPWVVVPAPAGTAPPAVEYRLACPVAGYVVGGTDARVTDSQLDVSYRAETGSPVSPGVTTGQNADFTGVYVGLGEAPTSFRPYIGCVPASGGGGESRVSYLRDGHEERALAAVPPSRPVKRTVVDGTVSPGSSQTITASCPGGWHLVRGAHAVAFRTEAPPSRALMLSVVARGRNVGDSVVVTARARASIPRGVRVLLQVQAICAAGGALQ